MGFDITAKAPTHTTLQRALNFFFISLFCFVFPQKIYSSLVTSEEDKEEFQSNSEVRNRILIPFVFYLPETQWVLGGLFRFNLSKLQKQGRVNQANTIISYTQREQIIFIQDFRYYPRSGEDELILGYSYFDFPDRYFGRGNQYSNQPEIFSEIRNSVFVTYSHHLGDYILLRGGSFYSQRTLDYHNGSSTHFLLEKEWSQNPKDFSQFCGSFGLEYDSRDYVESPQKGANLNGTYFWCNIASRWEINLRRYHTFHKATIANQFLITSVISQDVPFGLLPTVGGRNILRGYPFGWRRDNSLILWQSELRYNWSKTWVPVTFFSLGSSQDSILQPSRSHFLLSGGAGIHYVIDKTARTKLRLEWARGFESNMGVYFVNGEAF